LHIRAGDPPDYVGNLINDLAAELLMEYPFLLLCEKVAKTSSSIEAVIVTSRAKLAGSYSRKGFLLPNEERIESILLQTEIMMSIPISNEDYFGKVNCVMIDHSGIHNLLFPLRGVGVLGVAIVPPYDRDDLVARVLAIIAEATVLECDASRGEGVEGKT
jgi:hypothetical protein